MKLYKISLLALALTAGAFYSCSDDDNDYVVGAQSAGAYFPNDMSANIVLSSESSTASIPIMRTSTDATETVSLSVTDESGLFTIPTTVTFAQGSTKSEIIVTYDPSTLEADKLYPVVIAIPEGSQTLYGASSFEAQLLMKSPVIEEKGPHGTYLYTLFFSGTDPDLSTIVSYSDKTPDIKTYSIQHWGYDVTLDVILDGTTVYSDGTIACYVPEQYIGYDIAEGPVYIADVYTYTGGSDTYEGASYYDPQTGLFSLYVYYHIATGEGLSPGYEYFQLEGFPDYSLGVTYDGVFITAGGKHTYAVATVDVAADVEQAIVANVAGSPTETTVDDMINGVIPTETLGTGLGQEVRFEINGSGSYTFVALAIVKGEPVNVAVTQYSVELGSSSSEDADWETIGYAPLVDGWITAAFGNPFEYAFYVEVQENVKDENLIRMHNPYMGYYYENAQGAIYNEGSGKANIVFDAYYPELIAIPPQYSGFDLSDVGLPWGDEWYVGNYEGLFQAYGVTDPYTELWNDYLTQPDVPGMTIAEVLIGDEANTCLTEDGIYVPVCFMGGAEQFGWTWNDGYPAMLFLSELVESLDAIQAPAHKAMAQIKYVAKEMGLKKVNNLNIKAVKALKAPKNAKSTKKVRSNNPLSPKTVFGQPISKKDLMR